MSSSNSSGGSIGSTPGVTGIPANSGTVSGVVGGAALSSIDSITSSKLTTGALIGLSSCSSSSIADAARLITLGLKTGVLTPMSSPAPVNPAPVLTISPTVKTGSTARSSTVIVPSGLIIWSVVASDIRGISPSVSVTPVNKPLVIAPSKGSSPVIDAIAAPSSPDDIRLAAVVPEVTPGIAVAALEARVPTKGFRKIEPAIAGKTAPAISEISGSLTSSVLISPKVNGS